MCERVYRQFRQEQYKFNAVCESVSVYRQFKLELYNERIWKRVSIVCESVPMYQQFQLKQHKFKVFICCAF